MKKLPFYFLVILLLTSLLLGGCSTRPPAKTTPASPSSVDESSESNDNSSTSTLESSSSVPSESEVKLTEIDDAEKIQEARDILTDLLARASICDDIYSGGLDQDENMPLTALDDKEYRPVLEANFVTTDDIKTYWSNTFTAESKSSKKYTNMNERKAYVSMNGELYSLVDDFDEPLTLGEWDINTLKILSFTDTNIETSMEASLVGSGLGHTVLTLKNTGGTWRLTDSYFLD